MSESPDPRIKIAQESYPDRDVKIIPYADRQFVTLRPTPGQVAALARIGKSGRMDDLTRVAQLLDVLEVLLADPDDRAWLANGLLGGELAFGETDTAVEGDPTAMGLFEEICRAHGTNNREERRTAKKTTARRMNRG